MDELLGSWLLALEAARKSPHTIKSYRNGVTQFLAFCDSEGIDPDLSDPDAARLWLLSLARAGRPGTTMHVRLSALRAFAAWLTAEGELSGTGLMRAEWPQVDETTPPALTAEQCATLLTACEGRTFVAVRDAAIVALMSDSLVRADELLSMTVTDISLRGRSARVRRGKGGRERATPFSAQTAVRLDRYARMRKHQPGARLDCYWLALGRGPLTYAGLYAALRRRGERVGIKVYPHMLRAGGAITWRRKGGSTEALMTIAGWRDLGMVMRYTRAAENELALEEAQRLFGKTS